MRSRTCRRTSRSAEQAELYERYAAAAEAIEQNEDLVTAATRARELYLEAGRPLDAAGQLLNLFSVAFRHGEPTEKPRAYADQTLAEIADLPVTPQRERLRAWAYIADAECRFLDSDMEGARKLALQARELAASMHDQENVLDADLLLGRIDIVAGRYESGMRDGMRAAREARDAGYESVGVTGYRNLAILAARIMDPQAAEVALAEGLQYADAIEQSHCRQMMATTAGILEWGAGHWDLADERARQELVDRGCRRGSIGCQDVIGLVAMGRGSQAEARRWLEESLATSRHIGEPALILTPSGRWRRPTCREAWPTAAVERCQEAWSIASAAGERALFIPFVVTGARSFIAARRPDEAATWLAQARAFLAGWDSVAGAALSHADGLVRLAGGSLSAAREALERAIRGWDERGRSWEALWAQLDLAQCLIRMNRHADAAEVLAAVRARAEAIGSPPMLARADELTRASRGRGRERGAVAAADRPGVRGRAADRRRHDERGDRRRAVGRTEDGERPRRAHPRQAGRRASDRGRGLGSRHPGGGAAAARLDRRHALRRLLPSSPPRSKVVAPTTRQRHGPGS